MEHTFIKNFGINSIIGSIFIVIICYFIFLKNIEGITKINSIIVPILITIILIIGIKNIKIANLNQIGQNIQTDNTIFWIFESIIYSSYNLILVIPVLINLKKLIKSKKQIIIISILLSTIIFIITTLTFLLLINVDTDISTLEMPIVYVINQKYRNFKYIYGILILIAIFTTAISVGISFLNNISKENKKFKQYTAILCITSILISPIGFSKLVQILFPLFGYLGLIEIYFILKSK